MKYFADYMKERIYAIDENTGDGVMVDGDGKFSIHKDKKQIPWLSEENGTGFIVEEMTKKEFESFGITWNWAAAPLPDEEQKHSWRNYKQVIYWSANNILQTSFSTQYLLQTVVLL